MEKKINVEYLGKCLETLERAYLLLIKEEDKSTINYEMYRNSLVKGFEITLEQSGKLLKKKITPYFATKKAVDALKFKDIFKAANNHSLISNDAAKRWCIYRENRNDTAHDYGVAFAEHTLTLMDSFIKDVKKLIEVIDE